MSVTGGGKRGGSSRASGWACPGGDCPGGGGRDNYYVVTPCASSNAYEIVLKEKRLDLGKAEKALALLGTACAGTPVVLIARIGVYSLSIYASGRLMVKCGRQLKSKEVNALAGKIMPALENAGALI
jgi:hypothetical protein